VRRCAVAVALLAVVLAGCRKKETLSPNLNAANKVAMRTVNLYYETPRMLLAAEPHSVPVPESQPAAVPIVVRELMKGPKDPAKFGRLFPADTVVRGAYLLPGGTVIVDLGGTTLSQGWGTGSHTEIMAVYSLAQTLSANFADAKRVRIVVNGTPAETLAGHISLARSFSPRPSLLDR
jgi:spore germination protein GerM